jgi:hypothetical protein
MQQALEIARGAGWWYRKATSHTGSATLYCRQGDEGHCRFDVFGTGKAPGGPARSLKRMVRNCPHLSADDLPKLEQARRLIDSANRIVLAAESLIHESRLQDQMDEALAEAERIQALDPVESRLEVAERNLAKVDKLLDAAIEWELEASIVSSEAVDILESQGLKASDGASRTLDVATDVLRDAEVVLDDVPRQTATEVTTVRDAVADLRQRIMDARDRIPSRRDG